MLLEDIIENADVNAIETATVYNCVWGNYIIDRHKKKLHYSDHFLIKHFDKTVNCTDEKPSMILVTLIKDFPPSCNSKEYNFFYSTTYTDSIFQNWIENLILPFNKKLIIFIQNSNYNREAFDTYIDNLNTKYNQKLDVVISHVGYMRGFQQSGRYAMNRFLGFDMYFHDAIQNYEYICRIDSDAWFLEKPQIDPMCYMKQYDIGFTMLGMPEVGLISNEYAVDIFKKYFLKKGMLIDLNLYNNYGVKDTIMAGPFELYKINVFNNKDYIHFWNENKIDDMIDGRLHELNNLHINDMDTIREQFIKTIWIKAYVAPFKINYMGELSMYHWNCPFKKRCDLIINN